MLISMVPLVFLFEFSLILARWLGRPGAEESFDEAVEEEGDSIAEDADDLVHGRDYEPGDLEDDEDDDEPPSPPAATN